jgi:hypothetical protein
MLKTIKWLLRRAYREPKRSFSSRGRLLDEVRPPLADGRVIAYPDAFFFIEPADVRRAVERSRRRG